MEKSHEFINLTPSGDLGLGQLLRARSVNVKDSRCIDTPYPSLQCLEELHTSPRELIFSFRLGPLDEMLKWKSLIRVIGLVLFDTSIVHIGDSEEQSNGLNFPVVTTSEFVLLIGTRCDIAVTGAIDDDSRWHSHKAALACCDDAGDSATIGDGIGHETVQEELDPVFGTHFKRNALCGFRVEWSYRFMTVLHES